LGFFVEGIHMKDIKTLRSVVGVSVLLAVSLLSACDRQNDQRTAGQKLDEAVQKTERKSDEIKADAQAAGKDVKQAAANMADSASAKAKDMTITTQVNAQLARDERLSAMSINVDTNAGQVLLKGTAPDMASRERATTLAKSVEGVLSVSNELTIKPTN
jgi:hyperosmotically inducible periplasmic protein